jgi:hypothetical protein
MENIIGYVIGIPVLLIAAYVAIAIPYSVIIKPLYKAIKKTPETFKNTSAKLQRDNTRRTLKRLVDAMLESEKNRVNGKLLKYDADKVTKIQKEILWDMVGPLSKAQLKEEFFDTYIKDKNVSVQIKIGLEHVLKNFSDNESLWK